MRDRTTRGNGTDWARAGRRLRLAGVGLAAAFLLGATVFPRGATADPGDGTFSVWQGEAIASGVQVGANEKGFIVADILNANIPDGDSVANSSNQDKSRASTFYPGLAVSQGPSLLCTAGLPCGPGFPPPWPLSTYAQYPSQPHTSLGTGQHLGGAGAPLSLVANSAAATAEPAGTSTTATVADLRVPGDASTRAANAGFHQRAARILGRPRLATADAGTSSTVLVVGSGLATTSVAVVKGAVVSSANTILHHVSLLGGTVDISSIHATSTSLTDGAGVTKASGHVTISGVTVAGQAAAIDQSGVHVTPGSGLGGEQVAQLDQALGQALSAAGWKLQLLGVSQQKTPDAPNASAHGVMFYAQADASAVPMGSVLYSTFLLGSATSQASAQASPTAGTPSSLTGTLTGLTGGGGATAPAGAPGAGPASAAAPLSGQGGGHVIGAASPGASPPGSAAGGAASPGSPVLLASDGVAAHRTTMTYLTAALLALLLALAAPWALPALAGTRRRGP